MLAIGDLVIERSNPDYDVKNLEFIVEEKYIPFLKYFFKSSSASFLLLKSSDVTKRYELNKGLILTIHNANKYPPLMELLNRNLATGTPIKMCSNLTEFILLYKYLKYIHRNLNDWEIKIIRFNQLYEENHQYFTRDSLRIRKLRDLNFDYIISKDPIIYNGEVKHNDFKYYTAKELYELYSKDAYSQYLKLVSTMSIPNGYLKFSLWTLMSDNQKLQAITEYIYVNTVNNYLITDLNNNNILINDEKILKNYYKTVIMNSVSSSANLFFADYIMSNYLKLLDAFNVDKLLSPLRNIQKEKIKYMAMC
jgi:hypothetical protein